MDGAVQTVYPRKNWSSLMLFNCDHPSVRALTPEVVNRESGAYLHRLQWVADAEAQPDSRRDEAAHPKRHPSIPRSSSTAPPIGRRTTSSRRS